MLLSKSDFKAARSCPTKLYYRKRGYPSLRDDDEYLALLAEGGFMVQKMATLLYPQGRQMPFAAEPAKAAEATLQALRAREITLFEATLISNGKLARIDILEKQGNEFHLIEVKATLYNSGEDAAAVADGRPNLFRAKRSGSIAVGWREHLEDVTFQALVVRELFPLAKIRASLMMPDKAKSTAIDRLYSMFRLHRRTVAGSRFEQFEVEFTGDVDELRREHFLTLVPVDAEVEMLSGEVSDAAAAYVASLRPRVRKLVTPLSVACRGCEYQAARPGQPDGFHECWGRLADLKP
jgi:hypothetical protein